MTSKRDDSWSPERIKQLREKLGVTQKELGEKLGVHVITVTRWETGACEPSGLAAKMLDTLEVA
jgi:DNA-binding transcriptional regulator YiaG